MKILLTTLNAKYIHSNLALSYLCRAAENAGCEVDLQEFTINNEMNYIYTEILRKEYGVVAFSCYIWNIEKIKALVKVLKQAAPEMKILLGGPEVSYDAEGFLMENPSVDFLLRGEGEASFPQFCKAVQSPEEGFSAVKGLTYRDGEKICSNEDAPLLPMEELPFPYKGEPDRDRVIYYESARGCPYRCSYCLSSIEKKLRTLPMERTIRELNYFLDRKVKQVKFIDRTFNADPRRAYTLWKYLIDHDNQVTNFHFEICADLLTDEQIDLLGTARKGLFQLEIGIQSTNPAVLQAVNRNPQTERLLKNIERLKGPGNIHLHVDLIAGLPLEDYASFGKSFDRVYRLGAENLQLGFLKVLKGTRMAEEADRHGMSFRSYAPYEIIGNRYISPLEIVRLKMIESVLELYANRGGFSRTLDFLLPLAGKTPFAFYEAFSQFFYAHGFQHRSHKKEDLYRILLKFAESREQEHPGIAEKAKELLFEDLQERMNFDAVKKFQKKGWEINGKQ